jgi:Myb-like DNA-binding domain
MTGAARRGTNWTPEEDQRLLELIRAGKSWVFISANLKRPAKTARERLAHLQRQAIRAEFESRATQLEVKTKPGPRPKRSKGKWYVSFESKKQVGKRAHARATETFQNEQDAKAFARAKLADSSNISVGMLNPHLPKRTIASSQLLDWLNEPYL